MNSKPILTMRISYLCLMAIVAVILEGKWTSAAPSPQTEDVLKTLQQLDRLYSAVARPRFGKRGREDVNFLGSDYDHQEYQRSDVVNRKPGGLSAQKYILDLDPMYR
nr:neuropeptide F-like isoform X2 [Onthophagus taurus]